MHENLYDSTSSPPLYITLPLQRENFHINDLPGLPNAREKAMRTLELMTSVFLSLVRTSSTREMLLNTRIELWIWLLKWRATFPHY